jgi:hypothetical protein
LGGSKPLIKKDQSPLSRGVGGIKAPYQEGSKPLIKKDQSPLSRGIKAPLIKGRAVSFKLSTADFESINLT